VDRAARTRQATGRTLLWALVPVLLISAGCGNRAGRGLDPNALAAGQTEVAPGAPAGPTAEAPLVDPNAAYNPDTSSAGPSTAVSGGGTSSAGASSAGRSSAGNAAAGTPKSGAVAGSASAPKSGSGAATGSPARSSAAAGAPTPGVPAPGGGTAPAPAAGDKSPVTVGNIGTWSGVFGGIGIPMLHGVKAWVGDVNARGGLNGHPVRLVSYDDAGEPGRALSSAQRLVEQDKAIVILGIFQPTTEQAITAYLEQKQVPVMSTCNCAPADDLSPMIFPIGPGGLGNAWQHSLPLLTGVDQDVRDHMGLLYCQEAPICPDAAKNIETFQKDANFKIVWKAQASLAAPDYTSEMLAARNAGVKAIFEVMDNHSVLRIQRAANRQGFKPLHDVQFSMYDARFENIPELEGVFTSSPTPMWSISPKMADYREALKKYVPGGVGAAWGAEPFVAGKLLEKMSANFAPVPTPADVLAGLWSLKNETLGGLLPGITYYKGETHRNSNLCMVPIRIKGGKFLPRDGDAEKFICAPGWKPGMHG
jgi:branched-chain amino acid transport system substrate-binding protein